VVQVVVVGWMVLVFVERRDKERKNEREDEARGNPNPNNHNPEATKDADNSPWSFPPSRSRRKQYNSIEPVSPE
jgi:hypothetical protein